MDKKEQIEKMAKYICNACEMGFDIDGDCAEGNNYKTCGISKETAEYIYNAGYRKVPDGAVVLLIGENNQALDEKTIEYFVKHNEQIRKEAVKEFAEKLKQKYAQSCSEYYPELIMLTSEQLNELVKEYEK